ncbi:MAG TPA: elongation factor P hydroxylase [Gammaproteobacteria bacterium]|nr:elongation factor P hydroxylase [Gammaproteobacteria bacterium]
MADGDPIQCGAGRAAARHDPDELIRLFDRTFADSENTVLVRGGEEPLYLPADGAHSRHRILFAHGFFASALHEIAHWTIAGAARRKRVDYGYWYRGDGRTASEQADFESVELRPQAIEWAFSLAARCRFRVSVDNLSGAPVDRQAFRARVHRELRRFDHEGFPPRARRFIDVLCRAFGTDLRVPPAPGQD